MEKSIPELINDLVFIWSDLEAIETLRKFVTIKRNQLLMMRDRGYDLRVEEEIFSFEEEDFISFLIFYMDPAKNYGQEPKIFGPNQDKLQFLVDPLNLKNDDIKNNQTKFFKLLCNKLTRRYVTLNPIFDLTQIYDYTFVYYIYDKDKYDQDKKRTKDLATAQYNNYIDILNKFETLILNEPNILPAKRFSTSITISNRSWSSKLTKDISTKSNERMHTVSGMNEYLLMINNTDSIYNGSSIYRFQHFNFAELMYRAPYHLFNPKFRAFSNQEKLDFMADNVLADDNFQIFRYIPFPESIPFPDSSKRPDRFSDPVVKYFGWLRGTLVEIERTNFVTPTAVPITLNYRLVN